MTEEDRYTRITLRIPKEIHQQLTKSASERSHSMNAEIVQRLEGSFPNGWAGLEKWVRDPYNTDDLSEYERRLAQDICYFSNLPPDRLARQEENLRIALAALSEIERLKESGHLKLLQDSEAALRKKREETRKKWISNHPERESAINQDKSEEEMWQERINALRSERDELYKRLEVARKKRRLANLKVRARNMEIDRDMLAEAVSAVELDKDLNGDED